MICKICGEEFENGKFLSAHLKFEEHIKGQTYYDTYLKKPNEGICIVCGKPTKYINFTRGYTKTCSQECNNSPLSNKGKNVSKTKQAFTEEQKQQIKTKRENTCLERYGVKSNLSIKKNNLKNSNKFNNKTKVKSNIKDKNKTKTISLTAIEASHTKEARQKAIATRKKHMLDGTIKGQNVEQSWKTRHNKIQQYCKEHNCTPVIDILSKYGQGWLSLDIPRIYVNKQNSVISNEYLPIIEQYFITNQYSNKSKAEQYIIDNLDYTGTIIHNDRTILRPKEIDIYIPDLKIGIEYNGLYWHSIEYGTDKYSHRNKSLACRKLGIRLIHIFEFEDLDEQIQLLNKLISGIDEFDQNFTKNNLISTIPNDVEIIYSDDRYTIYSA